MLTNTRISFTFCCDVGSFVFDNAESLAVATTVKTLPLTDFVMPVPYTPLPHPTLYPLPTAAVDRISKNVYNRLYRK